VFEAAGLRLGFDASGRRVPLRAAALNDLICEN